MAKAGIIICLVLGALGVGIFIFYPKKSGPPTSPPDTTYPYQNGTNVSITPPRPSASPNEFVSSFYEWYIKGLATNPHFGTSEELKSWLTTDFASKLSDIASSTNSDPLLLSQDFLPTWLSRIEAETKSQTADEARVQVSLGEGSELHTLLVTIRRDSGWRIVSVETL
jgi:hypothetical protein